MGCQTCDFFIRAASMQFKLPGRYFLNEWRGGRSEPDQYFFDPDQNYCIKLKRTPYENECLRKETK